MNITWKYTRTRIRRRFPAGVMYRMTPKNTSLQHFEPQLLEKLAENQPLFMTEKDAVKCQAFAKENWWYVPVDAEIVEAENQGQKLPQLWEKIRHLV